MKRSIFLITIFTFAFSFSSFAATQISESAQKKIDLFMHFRMELSNQEKPEQALDKIENYHASHFSDAQMSSFTDEEKLILRNFEILEIYNYMRQIASREDEIKEILKKQYKVNEDWFKKHEENSINKWLFVTAGDMLSCNLRYAPVTSIIQNGLAVKSYYQKAIELDPQMSYALTNIAQWCYYAPAISGGGKNKAKNYFEQAVKSARTDAELYFADIFLSQFYFEKESLRAESVKLLFEAEKLSPGSYYIAWLKSINEQGYSLYYYNAHKVRPEDADKAK